MRVVCMNVRSQISTPAWLSFDHDHHSLRSFKILSAFASVWCQDRTIVGLRVGRVTTSDSPQEADLLAECCGAFAPLALPTD
jgi:hypothetical protein